MNYYNEHDLRIAAWLREVIRRGLIPDGEVDTRSIVDVHGDDLRGFVQCHFFAGIGGWSYALRLAGWPDERPVWSGSCPCQPWSSAGTGDETDDSRDLWPAWFDLIRECVPRVVFGEQVAGKAGFAWLDRVFADLETCGYSVGAIDLPACSVGAFHRRQRLWFVADSESGRQRINGRASRKGRYADERGSSRDLADSTGITTGETAERWTSGSGVDRSDLRLDLSDRAGLEGQSGHVDDGNEPGRLDTGAGRPSSPAGAYGHFWNDCDWVLCGDGKYRPVEPGTFPLADGVPARVVKLRGYGNAIVPQLAAEVIAAYLDLE